MEINYNIIKDDNWWILRITRYDDMLKFRNKVNFSKGYRKRYQLDRFIDSIKIPHFKTKHNILKILRKGPKTFDELSKKFKLNKMSVYGHLHGYKRSIKSNKKDNPGLIDMGLVKMEKTPSERYLLKATTGQATATTTGGCG